MYMLLASQWPFPGSCIGGRKIQTRNNLRGQLMEMKGRYGPSPFIGWSCYQRIELGGFLHGVLGGTAGMSTSGGHHSRMSCSSKLYFCGITFLRL